MCVFCLFLKIKETLNYDTKGNGNIFLKIIIQLYLLLSSAVCLRIIKKWGYSCPNFMANKLIINYSFMTQSIISAMKACKTVI